ncbi:hypothetical protein L7F22_063177 [Adiantum nelumboides]|nr:hypothetical protein [Adiantum nelumboides]
MDVSTPSHEDIVASNLLAFLSSSKKSATELSSGDHSLARVLAQQKGLLNSNNSSSKNSSASVESIKSSAKGSIVSGASNQISDIDDDGLQGNRMKPLSSLQTNCVNHERFPIPQFSKRWSPNSHQNRTLSKVLAAARVGPRAQHRAMYYCDNKENKVFHAASHIKEIRKTCPKHSGVKRKIPELEGSARLLLLRQRRSRLSSWRTATSSPKNGSSVLTFTANKKLEVFSKKTKSVAQEQTYAYSIAVDGHEHIQGNNDAVHESAISKQESSAVPVHSTLAAYQGFRLPPLGLTDESSYLFCADHAKRESQSTSSTLKRENLMGLPLTKPPAYPKTNQDISAVLSERCSSQAFVNSSCGKAVDAMELISQGDLNADEALSSSLPERLNRHAKPVKDSVCFVEEAGILNKDSSATYQKPISHVNEIPGRNNTGSSCQDEKQIGLTKPQYMLDDPLLNYAIDVLKLNGVKQEYVDHNSVETGLIFQISSSDCGASLARHLSIADNEGLMGQNPLQNVPSQGANQNSRSHPVVPRVSTLYQHHNNGSIPRVRRGRPPKKSNLCPCPEAKENRNKFARIYGPSGILGKLNPGIISRLRDKKQVQAVLEAVIRGAFINGKKENLAVKKPEGFDATHNAARCREGIKEREAIKKPSNQGYVLKLESEDQNTISSLSLRDDKERQRSAINRAEVDFEIEHRATLRACKIEKQEQCSIESSKQMACPQLTSEQLPMRMSMESLEACEVQNNKKCSIETAEDQKSFDSNVSFATGNVASCWLELLRLDIKGRLSALKRSKRRVHGALVSGQLDDKMANQGDEMDKWRAFFLQMEHVLHLEGTRLESWLNQIAHMQLSYCQKKGNHQSSMPPLCGFVTQSVEKDGLPSKKC